MSPSTKFWNFHENRTFTFRIKIQQEGAFKDLSQRLLHIFKFTAEKKKKSDS